MLNVLTIIEDGGMETLVSRIYKGLDNTNKFDLYLCALRTFEDNYLSAFYKQNCKDTIFFGLTNKNLGFKDYVALVRTFFKLAAYIKKHRIDVVNSHDFYSAFITRVAVLISRFFFLYKPKKNYVTLHNTLNWLSGKHNFINRLLASGTDKIICVSNAVYEFSRRSDKIKDSKYLVLYNGIDTDLFKKYEGLYESLRNELGLKDTDFVMGNVSTFSIRKGHIYLLEALKKMVADNPNLKLILVGSSRDHEENISSEIFAFINNNNLNNYVKVLEPREDIFKIYNILDLYVMPSIVEGYGLALAEAMSSELVCVGSDIPAFKELVKDGENGFLFKNKDSEELYKIINVIVSNYNHFTKTGKAARETIINKFSYKNMVNGYYKLYNISGD